jgi:Flp pilus assembly protein TadD
MPEQSTPDGQESQGPRPVRWPILLAGIVLASLVSVVFWPILGFEFVDRDVYRQVIDNPYIRGLSGENLKHIFTSRSFTSYYPIRTLTFAVDHQFWGLNPVGFKLTNGLIHFANVLLVFWLILRLFRHRDADDKPPKSSWDVCVATFSAAIFAVHPVVVEPVSWVAGREELLMTLGALGCFHFHLTARRLDEKDGKTPAAVACYIGAALSCAAACLSNAVAAVIPLLIVAADMILLTRPTIRKILYGTSALWAIGVATIVIKRVGPEGDPVGEARMLSAERLMLVLNVYWLNLKTLVWPAELALSYDAVSPKSFLDLDVILGTIVICLTCATLWALRHRPLILLGLIWFGLALGPTSQIIPHHIHRADRFLYLPLAGLALAVAAGLRIVHETTSLRPSPLRERRKGEGAKDVAVVSRAILRPLGSPWQRRLALAGTIAAGVSGLVLLGACSMRQVWTWQSDMSVWQHCVSLMPNNNEARWALAEAYAKQGRLDWAIPHYQMLLQSNPNELIVLSSFAFRLATSHDKALRDYALAIELAERGCKLTKWENPDLVRLLAKVYNNLATDRAETEDYDEAIEYFNKAINTDAGYPTPVFNLALLLATCSDEKLRRVDEAVRLAEQACQLVGQPGPDRLMFLAELYAEAERFEDAVRTTERAVRLAQAAGNWQLADELRLQLNFFRDQIRPDPSRQ